MAQKQAPPPPPQGSVVWATVLSWLSSLLLALLALCLVLMTTICSASYMKEQVNRSDFSEAAYSYLYDNFISYGASSGFSADVMTAALSRDQITADMADSITRLYQGDTAIDTRNAILNTTYDNLINDLNGRGVEVTSDVESAVVVVADACRLDYANYVTVPLASQLYTFIEKCSRVVPVAVAIMAVLCAVSLFVMLRLAGSSRYGVRCLTFAFTAAAALCALAATIIFPVDPHGGAEHQSRFGQAADRHLCAESLWSLRPVRPHLRRSRRDPSGPDHHRQKPHETPSEHLTGGPTHGKRRLRND